MLPRLLDDLSLLSPSSVSHTRGSLDHAHDICAVNATHAVNVDDFAPFSEPILSFPRLNGRGRVQADPLSLPLRYLDREGPCNGRTYGGNGCFSSEPRWRVLTNQAKSLNHSCMETWPHCMRPTRAILDHLAFPPSAPSSTCPRYRTMCRIHGWRVPPFGAADRQQLLRK